MKQLSWEEYYDGFYDWSTSTQKRYAGRLSGYGPAEEVWEIAQELECEDGAFAAKPLWKRPLPEGCASHRNRCWR